MGKETEPKRASGWSCESAANSIQQEEGGTTFQYDYEPSDKAQDPKYHRECVKEMEGKDFDFRYVQREGFDAPIVVKSKEGLHIAVPEPSFGVEDVCACVGSTRLVSVVDMKTQVDKEMTMRQFQKYWESEKGNSDMLVSLKFSHTKMEEFVKPPLIVQQLDWVERVWPRHLQHMQTVSGESSDNMTYPEVQKFVSMAMKGCFTNFTINPGGAAAWYHVLTGKAVFFLVPPTEENLHAFMLWDSAWETPLWLTPRKQFFGDMVAQCERVTIEAGQTFFLPSGWMHAIYMPEQSLVFNGKFLHSFGVDKQCEAAFLEEINKVPQKFRFPFFTEMLCYFLERFVHVLTGKSFIPGRNKERRIQEDTLRNEVVAGDEQNGGSENAPTHHHVHVTKRELIGLRAAIACLYALPSSMKRIPPQIADFTALTQAVVQLVKDHEEDDQELAITGKPLFLWPNEFSSFAEKSSRCPSAGQIKQNLDVLRRKRQRCEVCEGCAAENCGVCVHCHDMPKYGGLGKLNKPCVERQCKNMMVPAICVCDVCAKRNCEEYPNDPSGGLFECVSCGGIAHESCMALQFPDFQSQMVKEKDKEWLCRNCVAIIAASVGGVAYATDVTSGELAPASVVEHRPCVTKRARCRPKGWRKPRMGTHPGGISNPKIREPSCLPMMVVLHQMLAELDVCPAVVANMGHSGIHVIQPTIDEPASPLLLPVPTEEQTTAGVVTSASSVSPLQEPSTISFRANSFGRAGQTTAVVHNNGEETLSGQPNLEETTRAFGRMQL